MTLLHSLASGLPRFRLSKSSTEPLVAVIRDHGSRLESLNDSQLQAASLELRQQVLSAKGSLGDKEVTLAFALIGEAAYRSHAVRFYDVQFVAALSLMRNEIAEMQTGEGKTFVGAIAGYAKSLSGRGVHFMTTNTYLAGRDYQTVSPIFQRLGLSIGLIDRQQTPAEKQNAYRRDITYGPGYEFGFDYLRDQLALIQRDDPELGERYLTLSRGAGPAETPRMQRGHDCAIVDEADSVLIDEATTPLVLSSSPGGESKTPEPYQLAHQVAASLNENQHYRVSETNQRPTLTIGGQTEANRRLDRETGQKLRRPWEHYVQQALNASLCFARDVDYVISEDRIKIVDTHTGRIFDDRSWNEGLHQAVEVKEDVSITEENQSLAGISRQQYFGCYKNLCGMTGTAVDGAVELKSIYQLPVTVIATHRPGRRITHPMRTFVSDIAKWNAIADSVREFHATNRPVLVGSRTIADSRKIADRLAGLRFKVLNGVQDGDEAQLISAAGQPGSIMIATNMAGRGTDIRLGDGVAALGGLHVIVAEPSDTVRVDRQLMGRAARQGQPGSCQVFVSAEDGIVADQAPWMVRFISKVSDAHGEVPSDLGKEIVRLQRSASKKASAQRREMFGRQYRLDEAKAAIANR